MQKAEVRSVAHLIDYVGAGAPDSQDRGPVVIQLTLWDGRCVQGAYWRGPIEQEDVSVEDDVVWDNSLLRPHVWALLETGKPFVVKTGSSDGVCVLQWTLSAK